MSTTQDMFQIINQVSVAPESTVVLVGAALDGPSFTPFTLYDNVDPLKALGFSPLAHAYNAAVRAGINRILLYRINGQHATAIVKDVNGNGLFSLKSVSASDAYNEIHVMLFPDHLYIVNTDGSTRSYFFDKYPTVDDIVYGINRDAYYGLIEFNAEWIDQYAPMANAVSTETNVVFSDGDAEANLIQQRDPASSSYAGQASGVDGMLDTTGLLKNKLQTALFGDDPDSIAERIPYGDLAMLEYGVIVLVDMFHDDDTEFTEMLGSFCLNKTVDFESGCVGVIGTKNVYSSDDPHQRALDLVSLTESLEDTEAYKYVQVVVGHTTFPETNGESVSCAYTFGAVQALLSYNTMMSNKQMYGLSKLNFLLTKEDVALLSANGYTCIVPSIRRYFVPYFSTSYSKDTSSATGRPHNIRISQHITSAVSQEVDSLIGSAYTITSVKNAIDGAISILDDLQSTGVIKDYDLAYSLSDRNTSLDIEISFTPISEVTAISSITTLTFPREVTM
jgi:hypothetical protein